MPRGPHRPQGGKDAPRLRGRRRPGSPWRKGCRDDRGSRARRRGGPALLGRAGQRRGTDPGPGEGALRPTRARPPPPPAPPRPCSLPGSPPAPPTPSRGPLVAPPPPHRPPRLLRPLLPRLLPAHCPHLQGGARHPALHLPAWRARTRTRTRARTRTRTPAAARAGAGRGRRPVTCEGRGGGFKRVIRRGAGARSRRRRAPIPEGAAARMAPARRPAGARLLLVYAGLLAAAAGLGSPEPGEPAESRARREPRPGNELPAENRAGPPARPPVRRRTPRASVSPPGARTPRSPGGHGGQRSVPGGGPLPSERWARRARGSGETRGVRPPPLCAAGRRGGDLDRDFGVVPRHEERNSAGPR